MIYLMNDAAVTIFIIVLLIILFFIKFLSIRILKKISISILIVLLLILILIIGHSNWNKKTRLYYELNHLNIGEAYAPTTDLSIVKKIMKLKRPLKINTVSSVKRPFGGGTLFSDEIVMIKGKRYNITLTCYLYPLNFTPYETWVINNISEDK